MTMVLKAGQKWSVRARAEIPSFWIDYQVATGGTLVTLEQDLRQKITNHVGELHEFEVRVYHSWVASDTMDCTFVVTPAGDIQTGDVSLWQGAFEGSPGAFTPQNCVGYWVLDGCNARRDVWAPYQETTAGIWTDTKVVTEAKPAEELLRPSSSESWLAGFARGLNDVNSSNQEQDGHWAATVLADHAVKKLTGWDIVPVWLKGILIALPLAIVVGGTVYLVRTAMSLVKA